MSGTETRLQAVYNAGEAVQVIRLAYAQGESHPRRVEAAGAFRDGPYRCGYARTDDGRYEWWRDDKRGVADAEDEAWDELPGLIANPDYWDWIG
ncbi:MAG: hypothetical protein M3Q49_05960 [Actinomycetota bacterium]|nr:hypothetical protein [Actinomycetota bacterium]